MLESGTGSARPFPSEPEDPQGEEGVAARASRHENAEALILLHSSHIFIQSSVTREGVSRGTRGGDTADTVETVVMREVTLLTQGGVDARCRARRNFKIGI